MLLYLASDFLTMSPGSSDEGSVLVAGEMAHKTAMQWMVSMSSSWSPTSVEP